MTGRDLSELSDDELRIEARRQGMTIGRTLSREQLIDLLAGELGEPPESATDDSAAALRSPAASPGVFFTTSLARLLAEQGLKHEAAAVCRSVLELRPGDARARRLLADLEGCESSRSGREPDAPLERPALPERYGDTTVLLLARSPATLWVGWEVAPQDDAMAARIAGSTGHRVLQIFSAWRGPGRVEVESRYIDIGETVGDLLIARCRPGSAHRVALGWQSPDGTFAPAGHSAIVRTPPESTSSRRWASWGDPVSAAETRAPGGLVAILDRYRAVVTAAAWDVHDTEVPCDDEIGRPHGGPLTPHPTSPGMRW